MIAVVTYWTDGADKRRANTCMRVQREAYIDCQRVRKFAIRCRQWFAQLRSGVGERGATKVL
jgi:hypothetical protein